VQLMPDEPEARGLLALLLCTDARRAARYDGDLLVPLDAHDRSRYDRALLREGQALVVEALRREPGPYGVQAAIAALHTAAPTAADTDWPQIVRLYDQLLAVTPSPVVALNRAVALAEIAGPETGLQAIEALELDGYYAYHAVRADLLRRLGRDDEAREAYDTAISLTDNAAERRALRRRRQLDQTR
jgi:RNA polymerase sigma-70 factor, ECF subfamily